MWSYNISSHFVCIIFVRLWSVSGLKSASTPRIGIHWRHYLKSRFNIRVFSNQRPFQILRSMVDLLVRVRAYVSDVIGRRFEKVRNGHRLENWTTIWEFEQGHRFEKVRNGHRLENWTTIWEFEQGHRFENWTPIWEVVKRT